MEEKIILDLCGGTGAWSMPYKKAGYDVRLITLDDYDNHDVRLFKKPEERIFGILAAPPCDHLASSGAKWWEGKGNDCLLDALSIVDACLRIIMVCKPIFWALENPVGRLVHYLGKPVIYFHPYEFGDPYTKKTCLWGKFNPPDKKPVKPELKSKIHYMPPSPQRGLLRSVTPQGFAKAFFEVNQ